MKKVYCKNCKYSSPQTGESLFYNDKWCFFDENYKKEENWSGLETPIVYRKNAPNRNEKGNCSYYQRKWWKFWLKK